MVGVASSVTLLPLLSTYPDLEPLGLVRIRVLDLVIVTVPMPVVVVVPELEEPVTFT